LGFLIARRGRLHLVPAQTGRELERLDRLVGQFAEHGRFLDIGMKILCEYQVRIVGVIRSAERRVEIGDFGRRIVRRIRQTAMEVRVEAAHHELHRALQIGRKTHFLSEALIILFLADAARLRRAARA
jgi:hypothetical protein